MRIEKRLVEQCSWCKERKEHETLLLWRWINSVGEMKTPMMCGECFEGDRKRSGIRVSARGVAREWTSIEGKFNMREGLVS